MSLKDKAAIVGIGETDFSSNSGRTELHLLIQATLAACEDAGIKPSEIDGMAKISADETEAFVLADALNLDNLRYWATMPLGGNAGAGTVTLAALAVAEGLANYVLCWRSLNERSGRRFGQPGGYVTSARTPGFAQFTLPYGLMTPAQHVALTARRHMHQYGTMVEQFAAFTINSRAFAANNPRARFYQRPLTLEEYYKGRMIADPLRIFDCCLESDGAVAVIVTSAERARDLRQTPAYIMATAQGMGSRSSLSVLSAAPFARAGRGDGRIRETHPGPARFPDLAGPPRPQQAYPPRADRAFATLDTVRTTVAWPGPVVVA